MHNLLPLEKVWKNDQAGRSGSSFPYVKNKDNRIYIAKIIYSHDLFFKNIISGEEKLGLFDNVQRKRPWSDKNESPQSTRKGGASWKKSYAVCIRIFYMNATQSSIGETLCLSMVTRGHIQQELHMKEFWFKASLFYFYPPYSPDFASNAFHLFGFLQNSLNEKTFSRTSRDNVSENFPELNQQATW